MAGVHLPVHTRLDTNTHPPTTPPPHTHTQTAIEAGLFAFATANGAASYAHWFFPVRTGSGVMGSTAGLCVWCFSCSSHLHLHSHTYIHTHTQA